MAVVINDINTLQRYLIAVVQNAEHHAENVREVLLVLAGAVVLFKDAHEPIRVRTREGELKNELWAHINGTRYAFSYNHTNRSVDIRRGSHSGEVVASFSNRTRPQRVLTIFAGL